MFNEDPAQYIDLEVIKSRTNVPSETTNTRESFSVDLLERDVCCVLTGQDPIMGDAFHIIPYKRGSDVRFIICWGICLIVPVPSATIPVASTDCRESTKKRRGSDGIE